MLLETSPTNQGTPSTSRFEKKEVPLEGSDGTTMRKSRTE
ncbi:hypothetical protein LINGRAHAP2_LOCUS6814, partial [Linum grandiflorum]